MAYKLQLLHASDLEGGVAALENAPNFAAIVDTLEGTEPNSILISAGDNVIPGPFFNTAADFSFGGASGTLAQAYTRYFTEVVGTDLEAEGIAFDFDRGVGRVDISIMNIVGFDASALGNHEFDSSTGTLADFIGGQQDDGNIDWVGTFFPYLSANLDFSGDGPLSGLATDDILPAENFDESLADLAAGDIGPSIAPATVIEENGERIGVIGATTQILRNISSTGGVAEISGGTNDMAALAAVIQPQIDALRADGVNKIILTSHLQQIAFEEELAGLLDGVDIIIAGGSSTLQADSQDSLRDGDTAASDYPLLAQDAAGNPVAIVSTDEEYSYVGRLVAEFDDDGNLIPDSIDENVSGAFATDEAGVLAVTGAASPEEAIQASARADIVDDLTDAVQTIVDESDAITFGNHDVFLDGRRGSVRTEETNLGNLTADANLAAARNADSTVDVSFKNGGGIRAEIGTATDAGTSEGDGLLSQLDVQNSLRFNNDLTLVTLPTEGFLLMLEHGVAETEEGNTPGRFPQIGGFRYSFDTEGTAQEFVTDEDGNLIVDEATGLPQVEVAGSRIKTVALIDPETGEDIIIARDGVLTEAAPESIRMVTLDFLVETNGDNFPFQELSTDIQYLTRDGGTTPDADDPNILEEQEALTDFFAENHPDEDNAFAEAETDVANDTRIVQLARNGGEDRILLDEGTPALDIAVAQVLESGETELFTGGSEVVSVENGVAFVTNGAQDRIDVFDTATGAKLRDIDLTGIPGFDGVQSVAVKNGLVAAAISVTPEDQNGVVALFDADGTPRGTVEVGNLPDMVTFTADGSRILVANEGEPLDATDPPGGVSIIDVSGGADAATATTLDFTAFDGQEDTLRDAGVLIEPGKSVSEDLEPEYITVLPDGQTAWVSLQEANAYAVVDLTTSEVTDIRSFGLVDRSLPGNEIDASNDDNAISLRNYDNLFGMRQPDSIASVEIGGQSYILTANEGDARDATEADIEDLALDPTAFPNADILQLEENLGNLEVRNDLGDTDGDGDFDRLFHYGSRSFTIYDTAGNIVFDSGSQFSKLIAEIRPDLFNADDGEFDGRSDNKGVEPEAIATGEVDGRYFAFVGLERDNGIMVYDITDPRAPKFDQYIDSEANGNISPETIDFIPAVESATGQAQIAVAYEGDGNTVLFDVSDAPEIRPTEAVETFTIDPEAPETIAGTPAQLDGDTFNAVTVGDTFEIDGDFVDDFAFDGAASVMSVGGSEINLADSDLEGTTLVGVAARDGEGATTALRFVVDEQPLAEGARVDDDDINGVAFEAFVTGTGQSDIVINLDGTKIGAAFDNMLGLYEVDAGGNISDTQVIFDSTLDPDTRSFTLDNADIAAGAKLGFFMIQDGASRFPDLSAEDTFEFVTADDGSAGTVEDGDLVLVVNGEVLDSATLFHSINPGLNPDGAQHVLSGALGPDSLQFGFEDLIGGDNDFQDVVLNVQHDYI